MQDLDIGLVIGALLHDIGKVVFREGGNKQTHSESGYAFLKEEMGMDDNTVLDCVRYHHSRAIRDAGLNTDNMAYIVYIADNIASAIDRRKKDDGEKGFELHIPMQSVFNILNGNNASMAYSPGDIQMESRINFPSDNAKPFSGADYSHIMANIGNNLKGIELSGEYVNSLLEVLEANLSYIPSSTSTEELPDISLFDHLKLTAAFSCCIRQYLEAVGKSNYKECLFEGADAFYNEKAFLLASMDLSGIQKFIYTIHTKNALKTLRARSFYLEILMEHIIDSLLELENLTRSNLLYVGGGHCYLLLSNTMEAKEIFRRFLEDTNQWFINTYETSLYVAGGYSECSANDLKNNPSGAYEGIFKGLSEEISRMKMNRYSAGDIRKLNSRKKDDYTRECSVCKRVSDINEEGRCPVCASMEKLSAKVLYSDFFTVIKNEDYKELPLPGGCSLIQDDGESLKERMLNYPMFVRAYSKNRSYTGKHVATKLWVGNYSLKATFQEFAESSKGIKRVGILRADVDNLGNAFVSGFRNRENNDRYLTISRTATMSRQLSLFFKLHINKLMHNPEFTLDGEAKEKRNLSIVYSGGDDIFIVGAWNEIIEFAVDLERAFRKYTEGTLTLSAGIGLYDDSYPISVSAEEVEELVDRSKELEGKDGITLLRDGGSHTEGSGTRTISDGTYKWKDFEDRVIGEKYKELSDYFRLAGNDRGNSLLYRMLELIRNRSERLNFARFVYLLARLEPDDPGLKEGFGRFSKLMYDWIKNERDCRELKTAITLFVYLNRKEEEE